MSRRPGLSSVDDGLWMTTDRSMPVGVSLITQALYALVFMTRYVDLLWFWLGDFADVPWLRYWNGVLKVFYIASSLYIILLMMRVYPRTREREKAWKMGAACLVGSFVLTPLMVYIFAEGISFVNVRPPSLPLSSVLRFVCLAQSGWWFSRRAA